jgi:carboxymethylenebutenolidase
MQAITVANLLREEINITDTMFAYVSRPAGERPAPGLLVIQEIFGVNENMRILCDRYAAQGYVAVCPDLFHRIEPRINLSDKIESELQRAFELFGQFNPETGVEDIGKTLQTMRGLPYIGGKIGAVGYCLGGFLAYLTAVRTETDATISYYGVKIDSALAEMKQVRKPLLLHIAGEDQFVPPEAQEKIISAAENYPLVTVERYPGAAHAFSRPESASYDPRPAEKANILTDAFLKNYLQTV